MDSRKINRGRRNFIKTGIAGIVGATLIPNVLRGEGEKKKEHTLVYRTLGRTGIKLPVISMGAGHCEDANVMAAALDAGIVHLDTANSYSRGRNEELIGQVIKGRPRDSFVVGTKVVGSPSDRKTGLFTKETKPGPFVEKFETSLKRLGLDHVDILLLHSVVKREAALFEPILNALVKLKEQGKTRAIGVSSHTNEPEVMQAVIDSKVYDVVLVAYNFRQPHAKEMRQMTAKCAEAGVGVIAMKTQAGVYWDKERQHMINMKAAVKWVLQDENVHTTIPGIVNFDHLNEYLAVMDDLALSPEDMADLEQPAELGMNGLFCPQCSRCVAQCGQGLEIPTLMRSYMYAYGYKNLPKAVMTFSGTSLSELGMKPLPCESCQSCSVDCTMHFDVKEKITRIAELRHVPQDMLG